jgi:hypothetical protein
MDCPTAKYSDGTRADECTRCKLGQYQTLEGKTFCNDVKDTEYVSTASFVNTLTGLTEIVQTTLTCPRLGVIEEFSCTNGVMKFDKQGFW